MIFFRILLLILLLTFLVGMFFKSTEKSSVYLGLVLFLVTALIALVKFFGQISNNQLLAWYGLLVIVNYLFTFYAAYFVYKNPANNKQSVYLGRKCRVTCVVPVYNQADFIDRCVDALVVAGRNALEIAEVRIVVVDDCSNDGTGEILDYKYAKVAGVRVIHLKKNGGKKNALTCGMYGGENWRSAYALFVEKYKRRPVSTDALLLKELLRSSGCEADYADFYVHTDSDTEVAPDYLYEQLKGFLSDENIGALSGHFDVWESKTKRMPFFSMLHVAWYYTQNRVRKAAESAYDSVFCVSGPGAAFRSEAIYCLLDCWVDDYFGSKIYKGATDRMLTLLILKEGWKVNYCETAKVQVIAPDTLDFARKQWTRWKQNFWRMYIPVFRFAWRTSPMSAFLIYSRLLIASLAPVILSVHIIEIVNGSYLSLVTYLVGVMVMGGLMGLSYSTFVPRKWYFGLLRPFMSIISTVWGTILTLRAFFLIMSGSFVWKETATKKNNKWWSVIPFEVGYLVALVVFSVLLKF